MNFLREVFRKLQPRSRAFSYAWSRDTDGGHFHSIRHSRKRNGTRKPHGSIFYIDLELWAIEFYIAGIGIFCSCDLDLDPMTFSLYTNLTRIPWRYTGCANINFLRQGFRKLSPDRHTHIQTDRQTHRHDRNYINLPHRFAGGHWMIDVCFFSCQVNYQLLENDSSSCECIATWGRPTSRESCWAVLVTFV